MAPVEFEKELKKRLHSREAHPSEDAWSRIADRLDAEAPRRRRNPRWWMGLAAASIVFLAALVFFWEQPESLPVKDPVVEAPGKEAPAAEKEQRIQSVELADELEQAGIAGTAEEEKSKSSDPQEVSEPEVFRTDTATGATVSLGEPPPADDTGRIDELIAQQLDTLQTRIVAIDNEKGSVSDAQIDSLLLEAQRAVAGQDRPGNQSAVDASLLLAQAEDELDQTFREKIMEKVKSGVTRFRTAVAQHNK